MITPATRKELLAQETGEVFCNLVVFSHPSWTAPLRFVDDTVGIMVGGVAYAARGFDFNPPDADASDASATVEIEDVDRLITARLQSLEGTPEITLSCIRRGDPASPVDGPYAYDLSGMTQGGKGTVKLSLVRRSMLSYNASPSSYSNVNFPGLG